MSDPSLLDPETLLRLLRQLESTDVDELEVRSGSSRLYLRREPGIRAADHLHSADRAAVAAGDAAVTAPLSGVYYARPTPDQPPFVRPGALIEPGQVVALIETMKLFNEVIAEIGGEVVDVLVTDGELVEAGQPLICLRPGGAEQ